MGGLGTLAAAYGTLLLLTRQEMGDAAEAVAWLAAGVVVHDAVIAPLCLGAGVVLSRVVPAAARGPVAAGAVVLASTTLLALPVLGRFGARADNPTLLDRDYVLGWLVLAALVTLGVAGGILVGSRRDRGGEDVGAGARP
jgi:hypothetical protein